MRQKSIECFGNDLVIFIISGFLPGEYVLRVFPLICKATLSSRLSLSLLGSKAKPTGTAFDCEYEGPIYGIHEHWRNFQRIVTRGHAVYALQLEADIPHEPADSDVLDENSIQRPIRIFPAVERLHLSYSLLLRSSKSITFDSFPKLTILHLDTIQNQDGEDLLDGAWNLPLTSLSCDFFSLTKEAEQRIIDRGPPAFAQLLRTLRTGRATMGLVEILSRFCRNLKVLEARYYPDILAENPTLASLTLLLDMQRLSAPVDLTLQTSLTTLKMVNGPFLSQATHSRLEFVLLERCDPRSAVQFVAQCPALRHISIISGDWPSIAQITTVLNPDVCKRLTLKVLYADVPTYNEIEILIKQGFQINPEFLLSIKDAKQHWGRIVETTPMFKSWQVILEDWRIDDLLIDPSFFASFPSLAYLKLHSQISWDQDLITTLMKGCPMLKELELSITFTGVFVLQSRVLRKLSITFHRKGGEFQFNLANLTHLSLDTSHCNFLRQLLDGDPLLQLPLLSVLRINVSGSDDLDDAILSCNTGHQSLTQLAIIKFTNELQMAKITLQHLPCLRRVNISPIPSGIHIIMDLPGNCDITISPSHNTDYPDYTRKGFSESLNFVREVYFHEDENQEQYQWIEMQVPGKKEEEKTTAKMF